MNPLTLAIRQLRREWRSGELAVLIAALVVAVGALSAVGFSTDRVRAAVERRASESLAADLVILSHSEIPEKFETLAKERGLQTARTLSFPSVVTTESRSQLAEIRAVTENYPLRGRLKIAAQAYGESRPADHLPGETLAWAEPRLLGALGITTGARVGVGAKEFSLDAVLAYAPDQGFSFAEIAPMLLIRMEALQGSSLLGPGSRVSHRLLIAGDRETVAAYKAKIKPLLETNQRLLDIRDGRPELATAVDRADRFLNLAALVAVLLAGIAIAMAARHYAARETDTVAILKCLGASRRAVLVAYLAQLLLIALFAGCAGLLLGYFAQAGLIELLKDFIPEELPAATLAPAPWALLLGLVILAGFGLPPVLALARTAPIRVLRRDLGGVPLAGWIVYLVAIISITSILILLTGDLKLSLYVLGGVAGGAALLAGGAAGLVTVLNPFRRGVGVAWRFGVASIVRRGRDSVIQVTAFGLGMLVLLLLAVVRTDLLSSWQATLPENAPNHFLINIQPGQRDGVREFFQARGVQAPGLHAMVRARIAAINGTPVEELNYDEEGGPRSQRFLEREANLTWNRELPEANEITAGEWWREDQLDAPLVSVEEDAAKRLGVKLGDSMTFNIAGEELKVTVASLRRIDWDSFQPNFFMSFPPGLLEGRGYPATFITSLHLAPEQAPMLLELVKQYPSVTVVDLDTIISQVRGVMDQAALAVEYIFLFTLAAGVLVLLAAVQSTREERRFESAILRTLGASRRTVFAGVVAEFTLLGMLAAMLAVLAAAFSGWLLATEIFDLKYRSSPLVWLIGLIAGTLFVGAAGVLATRRVVRQPPMYTLRQR